MNFKDNEGFIDIKILRDQMDFGLPFQPSNLDEEPLIGTITGFEIIDNGFGFSEQNYNSFNTADSMQKEDRGGKGVGRFIWLKAFEKVEIDSIFLCENSLRNKRSFTFSLGSQDGISNLSLVENVSEEQRTRISLLGLKPEFQKLVPQTAAKIAQKIVEHCLEYFYLGRMPKIRIIENSNKEVIDLDDIYNDLVADRKVNTINIKGHRFDITNFLLHARSDLKHHFSYCANRRVVLTEKIGDKIPNLPPTLKDNEEEIELIFAGYISSDYLNKNVNPLRTSFDTVIGERCSISWRNLLE